MSSILIRAACRQLVFDSFHRESSLSLVIVLSTSRGVRRVGSEDRWRESIVNREIERSTNVGVERDDFPLSYHRAGEVPELAAIFDELDPLFKTITIYARQATPLMDSDLPNANAARLICRGEQATLRLEGHSDVVPPRGLIPIIVGKDRGFASAAEFILTAPPELDGPPGNALRLVGRKTAVFVTEDLSPPPLKEIDLGTQVIEVGHTTVGALEVILADGALVYLPPDAFQCEAKPSSANDSRPEPEPSVQVPAQTEASPSSPAASQSDTKKSDPTVPPLIVKSASSFSKVWPWAVMGISLFLALLIGRSFEGSHSNKPDAPSEPTLYYATGTANVRDTPDGKGAFKGALSRNATVNGLLVGGLNSTTPWLKITDGPYTGNYVWSRNLSTNLRPVLKPLRHKRLVVVNAGEVRVEPNADAALAAVPNLSKGQVVLAAGMTADGWIEVQFASGGVGYVPSSMFTHAKRHR